MENRKNLIIIIISLLAVIFCITTVLLLHLKQSDNLHKIIVTRRSIRRFDRRPISQDKLEKIVESAIYAPSASNLQPWEFLIIREEESVDKVFELVIWLKDRGAPPKEFSPECYIVILGNRRINEFYQIDCAMACQNILLTAWAQGIGSCTLGSVDRNRLRKLMGIPEYLDIFLVVALGYPAEEPIAVMTGEGAISPKMAEDGKWIVPKRVLENVVYWEQYGNNKEK